MTRDASTGIGLGTEIAQYKSNRSRPRRRWNSACNLVPSISLMSKEVTWALWASPRNPTSNGNLATGLHGLRSVTLRHCWQPRLSNSWWRFTSRRSWPASAWNKCKRWSGKWSIYNGSTEQSYAEVVLNLVLARGYIAKLLNNEAVARFIRQQPELLEQLEHIVAVTSLEQ